MMDDKIYSYLKDMARQHINRNLDKQNRCIELNETDTIIEAYIAGMVSVYNDFAAPNLLLDVKNGRQFVVEVK
jgi:hypothetical protein